MGAQSFLDALYSGVGEQKANKPERAPGNLDFSALGPST